jgi:hypothetical protein
MKNKNKFKIIFLTVLCLTFLILFLFDERFNDYRDVTKFQLLNESKLNELKTNFCLFPVIFTAFFRNKKNIVRNIDIFIKKVIK